MRRSSRTSFWLLPNRPQARSRVPFLGMRENSTVPNSVDPRSSPVGTPVIHDFLKLSRCFRVLMHSQVSQATHINCIRVSAFIRRGRFQQFNTLCRLITVECDYGLNLGQLYSIPDRSVWKEPRSLRRELLSERRFATYRQCQRRTHKASHGPTIS